jgi:hypothetical protein
MVLILAPEKIFFDWSSLKIPHILIDTKASK